MVTKNDFDTVLFDESLAVHVTLVFPIGKVEPEGGLQDIAISLPILSCVIVRVSPSKVAVPSTLSFADTPSYGTGAPEGLVALSVI